MIWHWQWSNHKQFQVTIFLDGEPLEDCFLADDELGVAYCHDLKALPHEKPIPGKYAFVPVAFVTNEFGDHNVVRHTGKVEIRRVVYDEAVGGRYDPLGLDGFRSIEEAYRLTGQAVPESNGAISVAHCHDERNGEHQACGNDDQQGNHQHNQERFIAL